MSITATQFKARFTEFASLTDARVDIFIDVAELQVNEGVWGNLYDEGLYYLTAHYLSQAEAAASSGGGGSTLPSGPVTSKSVGDVSVSFASSSGGGSGGGSGFFGSTSYGSHFWMLAMIVGQQVGVVGWTDAT